MALTYDAAAEEFVYAAKGTVRRFDVGRVETLENALAALEVLNFIRAQAPKNPAPRPDALRADENSRAIDEYVRRGGLIQKVGVEPYIAESYVTRRMKHPAELAKSGSALLAALNITPRFGDSDD